MIAFIQNQCSQYAHATIFICVPKRMSVKVLPVSPYANLTAFNHMVDKMEELGLWLIYSISE